MTKKQCPLGEACDLTIAWMAGAEKAKDQIKAQAAEIERQVREKGWIMKERDRTFALILARAEMAEAKLAKAVEDKGIMHIHAEALAEIKATLEGKSDQPIADIIAGCIEEVAAYRTTLAELTGAKP